MRRRIPYKAIINKSSYHQIIASVKNANNQFETGGVLVGYRLLNYFFIVAATSSGKTMKSKVSFILDGREHSQKVSKIIKHYLLKPYVIGVWHSHICDGNSFSRQDHIANNEIAEYLGGALSMIVTMPKRKVFLSLYYIESRLDKCKLVFL